MATSTSHSGDISLNRGAAQRESQDGNEEKHNVERQEEAGHQTSSEDSHSGKDDNTDTERQDDNSETELEDDNSETELEDENDENNDEEGNNENDSDWRPYSNQDLAAMFLEFYKYLTTLHYDPSDLLLPPPEGWDTTTFPPELIEKKSELVVDLMRHLPYFKANEKSTHLHYKSILIDYTNAKAHRGAIEADEGLASDDPIESSRSEAIVAHSDLLVMAQGYESGGRTFILDITNGEITEEVIRCDRVGPTDVGDWIYDLEMKFWELRLIPCPGREILEAEGVPEREGAIGEEEVREQEEEWGTELDLQFVRQILRGSGWGEEFRRGEGFGAVEGFLEGDAERRGEWEGAFH